MKPMPPIGVNGAIFRTLTWSRADDGRSGRDFDDDNASDLLLAVQHAIQGCKRSGWFSVQKITRNPTTISVSENLTSTCWQQVRRVAMRHFSLLERAVNNLCPRNQAVRAGASRW
jgi:hypothetical protein